MTEPVITPAPAPAPAPSPAVAPAPAPAAPQKAIWPDSWRQELAGADEKELKQLERYQTPKDVWQKARALEAKLSSGEYKRSVPFPDKGTPEEQAQWRADNGIPLTHDKYELKLKPGLVIGESDKPMVDGFLKRAHESNMPANHVNAALGWYFDEVDRQAAEQDKEDQDYRQTSSDALHAEWGKEYRLNVNLVNNLLDTAPKGIKEAFMGGRMADGKPIGSTPEMLKWLAGMARQINPVSTVVPGAGENLAGAITDEISKLEGWMKAPKGTPDHAKYWKDEKVQARYRELLSARDRMPKAS